MWQQSQGTDRARLKTVAEDAFLRFIVGWESFVSEWFIGPSTGTPHVCAATCRNNSSAGRRWLEDAPYDRYQVTFPDPVVDLPTHCPRLEQVDLLDEAEHRIPQLRGSCVSAVTSTWHGSGGGLALHDAPARARSWMRVWGSATRWLIAAGSRSVMNDRRRLPLRTMLGRRRCRATASAPASSEDSRRRGPAGCVQARVLSDHARARSVTGAGQRTASIPLFWDNAPVALRRTRGSSCPQWNETSFLSRLPQRGPFDSALIVGRHLAPHPPGRRRTVVARRGELADCLQSVGALHSRPDTCSDCRSTGSFPTAAFGDHAARAGSRCPCRCSPLPTRATGWPLSGGGRRAGRR